MNILQVIYCNETCRIKSYESVHKYECGIFPHNNAQVSLIRLSLVIFLKTFHEFGLDKYASTIRALNANTDLTMRGFNNDGKYDQFQSVYTFEGNEAKRSVTHLFSCYISAAIMVAFLEFKGIKIPDHQLGIVGESLLHIICVISSNANEIAIDQAYWNFSRSTYSPVSSLSVMMFMPVISLFNHHCDPNVEQMFYNGTMVVRAIKPIAKGSQVIYIYKL